MQYDFRYDWTNDRTKGSAFEKKGLKFMKILFNKLVIGAFVLSVLIVVGAYFGSQ